VTETEGGLSPAECPSATRRATIGDGDCRGLVSSLTLSTRSSLLIHYNASSTIGWIWSHGHQQSSTVWNLLDHAKDH
jgi:hypothetical protein